MALAFLRTATGLERFRIGSCLCNYARHISTYEYQYDPAKQRQLLSELKGGSVDLHKDDSTGIAIVTLNHPERKNAFSGSMMVELDDIVSELENWKEGRGILLHGVQSTFCSGGDLKMMKTMMETKKGIEMSTFMQTTLNKLFCLPLISAAFVEGHALGGGAEVMVSCDFRIFVETASVGFVQTKLGLTPGWGGGCQLSHLLGRTRALRLLSSGVVLTAREAEQIGLCDLIISKDDTDSLNTALNFLKMHTRAKPAVLQAAKKVILNALSVNYDPVLAGEREIFGSVFGGPAHVKAMEMALQKKSG